MASVIDCFVAKGQQRACKDGEEGGGRLWDARGSLLALGLCHGGGKCQPWEAWDTKLAWKA